MGIQKLSDWYSVQTSDLIKHGGSALLPHFEGSLNKALRSVFPELEVEKFQHKPTGFVFFQVEK